ncbi:pentapeptide repeat-containing protein [Streptomyces sp. NPDC004959]|uniref:pentapeptide repeat-containing protein n=1 Tax=unclassified Streptomyces TaxID=2593676 RepID=UPI000AF7CA94|nr:pentapeptide repeat-containing protein [Streptomyces sp. NRRL F-5630]
MTSRPTRRPSSATPRSARRTLAVRPPRRPELRLPSLVDPPAWGLVPDGDYDGVEWRGDTLDEADGGGASFLDCVLRDCALGGTRLTRARFVDSRLEAVRGVGTRLAEATLRDVEVIDARLGGTQAHGAVLERVVVRGGKLDYLNLRGAKLKDVVFEACVLVEPDFGGASLERVAFVDCVVKGADFNKVTLKDVDLRQAAELGVAAGIGGLRGAAISPDQLIDLAPALAAELGMRVLDLGE